MQRDDLFTDIHKAIRRGLFEATLQFGATDWDDPEEVAAAAVTWRPLHDLLQSHTRHEDDHILRLLDGRGPSSAARAGDEHRDLDDLLDELTATVDRAVQHPDPTTGRAAYRDLCRFIAAYLPHLHAEETEVMPRIWELCSDEEIAATRGAFMAEIGDAEREYTIGLLLPSIDGPTRDRMMSALAGAPAG